MRVPAALLTILILAGLAGLPSSGVAGGSRIQWEPGIEIIQYSYSPTRVYDESGEHLVRERSVQLTGQITMLSQADTALYTVYLDEVEDLQTLHRFLRESDHGAKPLDGAALHALSRRVVLEPLPLAASGRLDICTDGSQVPGMDVLAVINAAGDILDVRQIWSPVAVRP